MENVVRYNLEAERCARLAQADDGLLREAYRSLETSYRVLAVSVLTERWWPNQPAARRRRPE